ncbi:MAG: DUF167 domain-containing protein [Candidatus Nanoarchaeia archaeon]|nr:DUF167 domain-containing protein [Candidatus Nanoarchaeia archaeon]
MIINVKVKPNSKEQRIVKIAEREYEADLTEKAEGNKANIELVNLLSKEFGVDFRKIRIKNPRSRKKVVEILE